MTDLQTEVNVIKETTDEKINQMWDETSKFINSLEDKVLIK